MFGGMTSSAIISFNIMTFDTVLNPSPKAGLRRCDHCGLAIPPELPKDSRFCCAGCATVFDYLQAKGLGRYYDLRQAAGVRSGRQANPSKSGFEFLDTDQDLSRPRRSTFYVEGLQCVACVWLLEKIGDCVPGVNSLRVDLGRSVAEVDVSAGAKLSDVAAEIERFGYRVYPVQEQEWVERQRRENRMALIRVAVAGAAAGNIMLFAISIYAGATGFIATAFNAISGLLYLPVLFFSSVPLYREALKTVKTRKLSIDVPVVAGLLIAGVASYVNLIRGSQHVYFDSLSSFVFLLLGSRYLLKRAHQTALESHRLLRYMTSQSARKVLHDGTITVVPVEKLRAGDLVELVTGDVAPVDGVVEAGASDLDASVMTGESRWVRVKPSDRVLAGMSIQGAWIRVRVEASGYATRLGQIVRSIEEGFTKRAPIQGLVDRLSAVFLVVVFGASAAVFVAAGLLLGWEMGLERAIAMMIVTCPCGLALATPLALLRGAGVAARKKVLLKSSETLERLGGITAVAFDKTGTLTHGELRVKSWTWHVDGAERLGVEPAVLALESRSQHPMARALVRALTERGLREVLPVEDFQETPGVGVRGEVGGVTFDVARGEQGAVAVRREKKTVVEVTFEDRARAESPEALKQLRRLGVQVRLLSGDAKDIVERVGRELGFEHGECQAELTPEEKIEAVRGRREPVAMVGDGANDAGALAAADVGFAMSGGMAVSLRASDVYLADGHVTRVPEMVQLSREAMRVIRRNVVFSVAYNVVGLLGAALGWVNPLVAAVLMPASAVTVLVSSVRGTRWMRSYDRGGC